MIISTFRVTKNGSLILDKAKEIGSGQVYVFGENAAIAKYQTDSPRWREANPVEIIRTFLALEIEDAPDLVGVPISILRITAQDQRWIDPGLCVPDESR